MPLTFYETIRFMEPIQPETQHIRTRLGLRRLVNVAGPITSIGSTSVLPEVIQAMNQIMPENVDIAELQSRASDLIARITGAEAGCITNCTSAGISVAVAAAMTGVDQGRIEQLPDPSDQFKIIHFLITFFHDSGYVSHPRNPVSSPRLYSARLMGFFRRDFRELANSSNTRSTTSCSSPGFR